MIDIQSHGHINAKDTTLFCTTDTSWHGKMTWFSKFSKWPTWCTILLFYNNHQEVKLY